MKCNTISSMIKQYQPHVWVINETKSPLPTASHIHAPGYNVFENTGICVSSRAQGKWGVILGIAKSIHVQRVDTSFDSSLDGRAVVIDLVIPTSTGGFLHRVLGVYAPWDPGTTLSGNPSTFWASITQLCQHSPYSWSLVGDCNATLNVSESSSRSTSLSLAQTQYRAFLRNSCATDVWDIQGDADANTEYTFWNHMGRSVIDHAAHSACGVISSQINTLDFFIGNTDHRPIHTVLFLSTPDGQNMALHSYNANTTHQNRPIYPKS